MIEQLPFGRTGHLSTRTLFGAAALGDVSQAEADQTLELLLEYGVNHIDTAASYGNSETLLGPGMERYRDHFFLATKTGKRTYAEAREEIHQSLEKLRTSQIDLLQLHCLVDDAEWDVAMGPGGALEAAIEAREAGLVRFIGVTGHGLSVARQHKRSLERFDFDSVLLPWNFPMSQNADYAREFHELVAICDARDIAVQTIKSTCRRPWGEQKQTRATWYQPMENQDDIDLAVGWVLGHPNLFLNTAGDIHLLPRTLEAASRFEAAPDDQEMQYLLEKAAMEPLFV
ncbi:MAG TPA: aldo/keto reductase [Abditibacterium sp.]|jgi:aryl-alcohol dehydrogenase-like predicted oxidoreductase